MKNNLQELDKKYIIPTYGRNYTNFVSGKNATLKDDKGNDYIDFTSGIGVVSVGHANDKVSKAICDQVSSITHISNLYVIEPQAKCAQRIVSLSGYDMQCFFANSGAESNEGAIKIARKYGEIEGETKRYKIITLDQSFHGRTITALKATGQEVMHNYFGPFPDGFTYASDIDAIEGMIDDHTVAVMIELVQGEGGVQPLDKTKVQALSKMLKSRDILLIVDEVQTGVYRTGEFLASNVYEITPDIITLAKGLGGGVPIGVVMTSKKEVLTPGDHGSTFGGNYLSTAASNTVMDILSELKDSGELDRTFIKFEAKLEEVFSNNRNLFTSSVGFGLMRGLRVKNAETLANIIKATHDKGLLMLKAGRNTLRFLPPLTISDEEIIEGFKRLDEALSSL
ncbi:MAG: aspartate aminotransferase family protein [Arcobacter sp.]|nr:MAG: aspartate aminotransferase family protein [Arcobacter sp.]